MYFTNEMLINGNGNVLYFYRTARERWEQLLNEVGFTNPVELASRLTNEQFWFEHYCGGKAIGQEVMVTTGLTMFYSTQTGYGEYVNHAYFIYQAFMQSYCSVEVKSMAQKLAQDYGLVQGGSYAY
ncbi:hypothetical protein [Vibrio sp. V15_P4S5T153]|uniref:hypothetical protein n=1 Tax=Vibrio sp. V15_P4S5T153 TaxID=1938669 RepID=UPI000B901363|nr:hypothetical protein [Vibrio sp. V15_P4S5T153]OXX63860.1 hypothetical protein B9J89_06235 [Vibrio sp. V15_P4S5T153]